MTSGKKKALVLIPVLLLFTAGLVLFLVSRKQLPDSENQKNDITRLRLLTVGSSNDEACQRISKALSEITMERYGFSVEITQVPLVDYDNTLSGQFLNGNEPDLFGFFSADHLLRYAREGRTYILDSYLTVSSPLYHNNHSELWQYVKIDGKIHAVPSNNSLNYRLAFCARADIVEALGISTEDVTNWNELHELLLRVKKEYPEITPVVPHTGSILPGLSQDPLGDNLGVLLGNQGTTVVNLYASEEYAKTCQQLYEWQQEGLILPRAFTYDYSSNHAMKLYNGFGFFANINTERLASRICAYGNDLTIFTLSPSIANSSSVNSGWCISAGTPYKKEAIQLLELLYTDKEACDLCIYGQENIDYKRLDKSTITQPETPPESIWEHVSWAWPNRQLASTWVLPNGKERIVADYGAQRSPAMGFMFDSSSVQAQSNRCTDIVAKYDRALLCGYLDPAEALPQFLKELEEAGIDQIIAEKQAQLNLWLSSKN